MIKSKKSGDLIIISGTTCAGKGTVIKELLKRNKDLCVSISCTSRPKRDNEIDGKDYYFLTREEFEKKIKNNEFLEYAKVQYGEYYGTPKAGVKKLLEEGKNVILEIDVEGAKQIKKMFPETILIFVMAPSMEEVKRRIKSRGKETPEQIIKRFKKAYQEINEINEYNYVVVNDEVDNAVHKIESILTSVKCRVDRIEDVSVENEEEIIHEFLIGSKFDNKPFNLDNTKTE